MLLGEWQKQAQRLSDVWGKAMRDEQAAEWFVELARQDAQDVRQAIQNLARTEDRAPSLAKLISATREARRQRFSNVPQSNAAPGEMPEGVVAVIRSKNYQDWAIEGHAPWSLANARLPENIEITEIIGVQPVDRRAG